MTKKPMDIPPPAQGNDELRFRPIGLIRSCFPEKFGIPQQSGMVAQAEARLELVPPYDRPEAVQGLEGFSHIWILFLFHASLRDDWKPTVRPPRLGGNRRVGVFASRSPFRPNRIGLSAMALKSISLDRGVVLRLAGVDLLDGTPVLDIKPYLPYADSIPVARSGYAQEPAEPELAVLFEEQPLHYLRALPGAERRRLRNLITGLLLRDPRPGYLGNADHPRRFGLRLENLNICWTSEGRLFRVTAIEPSYKAPCRPTAGSSA